MSDDKSAITFLKFFKKVENKDFYHHEPKRDNQLSFETH